jgi:cell division septation protein DedD
MSSNARPAGLGRWIIIGAGVFLFAVFAAVLWYAYVEVMGLGAGGPPPLNRAEAGPIKRPPDDPGGMEIPNRDSAAARVFGQTSEGVRLERILPRQDTGMVELEPEPVAPVPPTPAPPPTAAEPPAPAATAAGPADVPVEMLQASEPDPATMAPETPTPEPTAPEATAEAPPAPVARPSVTVTARPPQDPAPTAQTPRPPAAAAAPPRAAAPSAQTAARTPPARSAPAASPIFRVQLGAFRSDTAASQAWVDLQRRLREPLGGLRPTVLEARTSSGTFYRLQAGPLPSRDGAARACAQVKAGGNDCFIVGPLP